MLFLCNAFGFGETPFRGWTLGGYTAQTPSSYFQIKKFQFTDIFNVKNVYNGWYDVQYRQFDIIRINNLKNINKCIIETLEKNNHFLERALKCHVLLDGLNELIDTVPASPRRPDVQAAFENTISQKNGVNRALHVLSQGFGEPLTKERTFALKKELLGYCYNVMDNDAEIYSRTRKIQLHSPHVVIQNELSLPDKFYPLLPKEVLNSYQNLK